MRTEAPPAIAEILLLEQNTADVALIKESTESANVTVVAECPDILSFLRRQGEYETARRPDLIILDLDLARTEDCEMLTEIKRDPRFKRIPICQQRDGAVGNSISWLRESYITRNRN